MALGPSRWADSTVCGPARACRACPGSGRGLAARAPSSHPLRGPRGLEGEATGAGKPVGGLQGAGGASAGAAQPLTPNDRGGLVTVAGTRDRHAQLAHQVPWNSGCWVLAEGLEGGQGQAALEGLGPGGSDQGHLPQGHWPRPWTGSVWPCSGLCGLGGGRGWLCPGQGSQQSLRGREALPPPIGSHPRSVQEGASIHPSGCTSTSLPGTPTCQPPSLWPRPVPSLPGWSCVTAGLPTCLSVHPAGLTALGRARPGQGRAGNDSRHP